MLVYVVFACDAVFGHGLGSMSVVTPRYGDPLYKQGEEARWQHYSRYMGRALDGSLVFPSLDTVTEQNIHAEYSGAWRDISALGLGSLELDLMTYKVDPGEPPIMTQGLWDPNRKCTGGLARALDTDDKGELRQYISAYCKKCKMQWTSVTHDSAWCLIWDAERSDRTERYGAPAGARIVLSKLERLNSRPHKPVLKWSCTQMVI